MKKRPAVPVRHLIAAGIILAAAVLLYTAVMPTVVANHYLSDLNQELLATNEALRGPAQASSLPLFTDPDISLTERNAQIQGATGDVAEARKALTDLDTASQLTKLPGGDIASNYRTAVVRQKQSQNLVAQSELVLGEYHKLLTYLRAYTDLQVRLTGSLDSFNSIRDFSILTGKGSTMLSTASTIRTNARALQAMPVPAEFDPLKTAAEVTFERAANGFTRFGNGLNNGNDTAIYNAARQLEAVTHKNTVDDKNLLVTLADTSPTLQQLAELPEKAEIALGH